MDLVFVIEVESHPEKRLLGYEDFELRITRAGERYRVQVLRSPGGEASGYFDIPLSRDRIELLILQMGQPRRRRWPISRSIHTEEMQAARELGGKLFEAVMAGEVLACFRSSLRSIYSKRDTGLRIKLRLEEVPELAELPWELLRDAAHDRFLSLSAETPVVRYLEVPQYSATTPLPVELPLRVLVMVSSPSDYQLLDVERERKLLDRALKPLQMTNRVHVTYLEGATLRELRHVMRQRRFHVFHFIGHGGFDTRTEAGMLVLEDENGRGQPVRADRLAAVLQNRRSLRLAILNACEGARNSRQDPYSSVATRLIQQGVPAVIAMQFEITDRVATTFADELYTALAEGWPVDAALAEARSAIFTLPSDIEWGTPVLYLHAADGALFDVGAHAANEPTLTDATQSASTINDMAFSDVEAMFDQEYSKEYGQELDQLLQSTPSAVEPAEAGQPPARPGAVTAELPPLGSEANPVLHFHTHYHSDRQSHLEPLAAETPAVGTPPGGTPAVEAPPGGTPAGKNPADGTPTDGTPAAEPTAAASLAVDAPSGFPNTLIPTAVDKPSRRQSRPSGRFPATLRYPDPIPRDKRKPPASSAEAAVEARASQSPSQGFTDRPDQGFAGFPRRVPRTQLSPEEPPTLPRRPDSMKHLPITLRTEDFPWIPTSRRGTAPPLEVAFSPLGAGSEPAATPYSPNHYPVASLRSRARWVIPLLVASVLIAATITALTFV